MACSADTKLLTGGFNDDEAIIADIGGEGVIQYVNFSPAENFGYSLELLTRGLEGTLYADFVAERVDSLEYAIDSKEDIENVMSKGFTGTGDLTLLQITNEEVHAAESFEALQALYMSEQLSVDGLKNK